MSAANLQTEWAALFFKSLADAGVRDIVISPGSRSTPFVVAAVREPRLTRHEAIDERAAAFFALGQARVTGRPSVLLCTSGTAPAHYLPAMIEANLTGTPMLVVSADRPPELYECSSPQTIDQVKLFGENARQFFDLVPEGSVGSMRALRRVAAQAVAASLWPRAGAIHVNARARKPLEPVVATRPEEIALAERARAASDQPITFAAPPLVVPSAEAIDHVAAIVRSSKRGIIVAGPAPLAQRRAREAIWQLARATGFPIACEATSQLRFGPVPSDVHVVDGFDLLLRSRTFREHVALDAAIQIGAPPTSGAWEEVAASVARIVIAERGWPDPHGTARAIVHGDVGATCAALAKAIGARPLGAHVAFVDRANTCAWRANAEELAADPMVEANVVEELVSRAPSGSLLVVGNSLAVRLIDIYVRRRDEDIGVLSQRGASGIDGLVAGAAGAASSSGQPLALLLGDVTLLHDLTSLALAARAKTPLVIVVLHNGGGRIFEQLPISTAPGIERSILEHATTPHDIDFAPAARTFGVRFVEAKTRDEVRSALDAAYRHAGCTLVQARVAPSGSIARSARVTAAVERAIASLGTTND